MTKDYTVEPARQFNVRDLFEMMSSLELTPPYQRSGDVWHPNARSLFIDSLANGFAVPTIYLHQFPKPDVKGARRITHAVVDGKQRLMAIKRFFENELALPGEFRFYEDSVGIERSPAAGKRYEELRGSGLLNVRTAILRAKIPVVEIRTSSDNTIRKMFRRLNSQGKLNAAEFRNSFPGEFPPMTWQTSNHEFMKETLAFDPRRYKHYDVAAKFLVLQANGPVNLRKSVIDAWAERFDPEHPEYHGAGLDAKIVQATSETLDRLQVWFREHAQNPVAKKDGTLIPIFLLASEDFRQTKRAEGATFVLFKLALDAALRVPPTERNQLRGEAPILFEFAGLQRRNEKTSFEARREILRRFATDYGPVDQIPEILGVSAKRLAELSRKPERNGS